MPHLRIKLLIVCEFFPPHIGGGEKLLLSHAVVLALTGKFDVRVITSKQHTAPAHELVTPHLEVYRYNWFEMFGHPIARLSDLSQHITWANHVHTVTYSCAAQSLYLARMQHKPIIITFFEILGKQWFKVASNPFVALIFLCTEQFLLKLPFTHFHAISNHTHGKLVKHVQSGKTLMIYPFVDVAKRNNIPIPYKDYFLFFGRAGRTKGLRVLIRSIADLQTKGITPLFILIIADHPSQDRKQIVEHIKKHQLKNVIVLSQQSRDKLVAYIQNATVVVVPSLTEGFGFSAYEASALGKPVIYSSETSLEEVVSAGIQFENADFQSLARTIAEVDTLPWKTTRLTINNAQSLDQWIELYESCL
jgi:glycosyltransferase involved in cell wall biosynthesis